MIHAICDFCGKETGPSATLLTLQPFQNHAESHNSTAPYGHTDKAKSFVICHKCIKKHGMPNPFHDYKLHRTRLEYEKNLDSYTEEDFTNDIKEEKTHHTKSAPEPKSEPEYPQTGKIVKYKYDKKKEKVCTINAMIPAVKYNETTIIDSSPMKELPDTMHSWAWVPDNNETAMQRLASWAANGTWKPHTEPMSEAEKESLLVKMHGTKFTCKHINEKRSMCQIRKGQASLSPKGIYTKEVTVTAAYEAQDGTASAIRGLAKLDKTTMKLYDTPEPLSRALGKDSRISIKMGKDLIVKDADCRASLLKRSMVTDKIDTTHAHLNFRDAVSLIPGRCVFKTSNSREEYDVTAKACIDEYTKRVYIDFDTLKYTERNDVTCGQLYFMPDSDTERHRLYAKTTPYGGFTLFAYSEEYIRRNGSENFSLI